MNTIQAEDEERERESHGHPNIFQLIELLQKEQATTDAIRIQLSAGGKRKLKKKKYQVIDRRLIRLKQRLVASQMTVISDGVRRRRDE